MKMKLNKAPHLVALLSLATVASFSSGLAKPITYEVNDPKNRDLVSFTSDAPIEVIVGHTSNIKGTIELDDSMDLSKKPLDAAFTVDLASIDTGIPLRNEHMRDNFLETKKYPSASFKLKSLVGSPVLLADGKTHHVKAKGEFAIHGKTAVKDVDVDVTYFKHCPSTDSKFKDCDLIQIKAKFPVALQEHDIKRPEVVFQKLADTVFVTVNASAHRQVAGKTGAAEKTPAKPAEKASTKPVEKTAAKPAQKSPAKQAK